MDLKLVETNNGGDIIKNPKDLQVIYGLENMPYLALFGGNVNASTPVRRLSNEQAKDWWGNTLFFPNDAGLQFNSLTEGVLQNVALNSSGRVQIEQAVLSDLAFMKEFAEVSVSVSIPATDRVEISITIQEPDNQQAKEFTFLWDATKNELSES